jgi:hypothetical protein
MEPQGLRGVFGLENGGAALETLESLGCTTLLTQPQPALHAPFVPDLCARTLRRTKKLSAATTLALTKS